MRYTIEGMINTPYFNPELSYDDNFKRGPFGAFADHKKYEHSGVPEYELFGFPLFLPFGIPAGPLLNGKFVKAALDKGFDIPTYKTVRSHKYPSADWPNVLSVNIKGNLTLDKAEKGLIASHEYKEPLAITNSFGVPSYEPDFWQKDMADCVAYAHSGQMIIGSFQGTTNNSGNIKEYIQDFVDTARLVKETGIHVLEANLSCPNEGTAHLLCYDISRTQTIVDAIKNTIGNTPLIIKIGYFVDHDALETLIHKVGKIVDGIAAINTIPAKITDAQGNQALPGKNRLKSGVCGAPIKWAGLEMVKVLATLRQKNDLSYQIFGVGGVTTAEDYMDYKNAGADAVMSATGSMWNPYLAQEIKKDNGV
jgi:dihydroorotate dehydrogenase